MLEIILTTSVRAFTGHGGFDSACTAPRSQRSHSEISLDLRARRIGDNASSDAMAQRGDTSGVLDRQELG